MPELPEVEVVRSGLESAVTGSRVSRVDVLDSRSLRRHDGPLEDFVEALRGSTITAAVRRGKFLWFPLEGSGDNGPRALVAHLGMSGQVLLRDRDAIDRLTRIRIDIENPHLGEFTLNFVDQRIFGSMAIDSLEATPDARPGGFAGPAPTAAGLAAMVPSQVAHIARDPLDPAFVDRDFLSRLAQRRTGIKRALLDQSLISGIGNIYADESLWAARVHFDSRADSLSPAKARLLLAEVRAVLSRALAEGGTSFDSQYVNVNGNSGYFSHSLNVYGQHGKACPRCGRAVIRESFMNRNSHFCAHCQRRRLP